MISRRAFVGACAATALPAVQAVSAPVTDGYSFRFEWLEQGDASANGARIDLGRLSASAAAIRERRMLVRRRLALRIDGPGTTARLLAVLTEEPAGLTIRVDGLPLSRLPRLLDPAHRLGTAVTHRIEIDIPTQVAPGPILGRVQWLAEPS
jgi:hypothetical protein